MDHTEKGIKAKFNFDFFYFVAMVKEWLKIATNDISIQEFHNVSHYKPYVLVGTHCNTVFF